MTDATKTTDADTSTDLLVMDVADRIATLTLNRPKARNALSSALLRALRVTMADAEANPDVDVIILTGADPAFSAGLDLKELGSTGGNVGAGGSTDPDTPIVAIHPWTPTTKPVIGAINGVAITGGFELALNCDFLVASERASFGDTHTRVGVLPGWGLSVLLPQAIGLRRSIEMSLTGNFLSANDALDLGLVNHVVPHEALLPTTRKLAADIVQNSPAAVRELLVSYRAIHRMTVGEGEIHEAKVGRAWLARTFDPAAVEARRAAIVNRGRNQV
jgi:enoyl-CoA hydratase